MENVIFVQCLLQFCLSSCIYFPFGYAEFFLEHVYFIVSHFIFLNIGLLHSFRYSFSEVSTIFRHIFNTTLLNSFLNFNKWKLFKQMEGKYRALKILTHFFSQNYYIFSATFLFQNFFTPTFIICSISFY